MPPALLFQPSSGRRIPLHNIKMEVGLWRTWVAVRKWPVLKAWTMPTCKGSGTCSRLQQKIRQHYPDAISLHPQHQLPHIHLTPRPSHPHLTYLHLEKVPNGRHPKLKRSASARSPLLAGQVVELPNPLFRLHIIATQHRQVTKSCSVMRGTGTHPLQPPW